MSNFTFNPPAVASTSAATATNSTFRFTSPAAPLPQPYVFGTGAPMSGTSAAQVNTAHPFARFVTPNNSPAFTPSTTAPSFNPFKITTPVTTSPFTSATTRTAAPVFPSFNPPTAATATPVFTAFNPPIAASTGFNPPTAATATPVFTAFNPPTVATATPVFTAFNPPTAATATPVFTAFNPPTVATATPVFTTFNPPTAASTGFKPATAATATPVFTAFNPPTVATATPVFTAFNPPTVATATPVFTAFNPPTAASTGFNPPTAATTTYPGLPPPTRVTATPMSAGFIPATAAYPGFPPPTTVTTTPVFPSFAPTPTATMAAPLTNPQLVTSMSAAQSQPTVSTTLSQSLKQEKPTAQSTSIIQQGFLAATLLDPYSNRGTKDFTLVNRSQVVEQPAVVSTASASPSTNTDILTTSAPIPVSLPVQSGSRTSSPARPVGNINLKLQPVSSSPTLTDMVKSANQQPITSTTPVKSTLTGGFTDEEELVLLSRNKMSKLRISSDFTDASHQPNSLRSLYPARSLADFEKLNHMPPPSSLLPSPVTTTERQRPSRSSSEQRDTSSKYHSTAVADSRPSSSPNTQKYCLPILTRENYYTKPTMAELKTLFNGQGECLLKQFTVGHEKYGSVTFYGQMNVAGLNLDKIIEINRQEVTVYPDDDNKPPVGEELNRSARITLLGVYPIDRATRQEITDVQRIKEANYTDYLREMTKKFNGEFVNYEMTEGAWTFMVKHFTRYGLDDHHKDCAVKS